MTKTMLERLSDLRCHRCGGKMTVRADRPLTDAEDVCILSVRCPCGYQASAEAMDPAEACGKLLRLVLAPKPSIASIPYNRRDASPSQPYLEAV